MNDFRTPSVKGTGKNQTMARDVNLSLIMNSYLNNSMSKADISRLFKLSKPTSSKITAELEELGLIRPDPDASARQNTPGVKPLKYKLNAEMGLIAVLDLSTVETQITLCDFSGRILSETNISDKELIRFRDIVNFCDIVDHLIQTCPARKKQLLAICVAIPCALNRKTQKIEWSPRFEIDEDFDLFAFLASRYPQSKILVENDVQLMMSGEIYKGLLSDGSVSYALLMYVDSGLGGSFFMDGRQENGEEGKAGDLGFFPCIGPDGESVYLDSVISINAIKKTLKRRLKNGEKSCLPTDVPLRFAHIREAYRKKDPLVLDIVEDTARKTANALKNLLEILNINFIIITGRITQFGEHYRTIIENSLKERFPNVRVRYSRIQDSAIREGAMLLSARTVIADIISHRAKKF